MLNKGYLSSCDKLKFKEAVELYKKVLDTEDKTLKKIYMDKLILGTLYFVYDYIEKNNLELLTFGICDIDDIISSFTETWIKKLHSGMLLNVVSFSQILNSSFFTEFYENYGLGNIGIVENFGISKEEFVELLLTYITCKNNNQYELFREKIVENIDEDNKHEVIRIISIFAKVYNNLEDKNIEALLLLSRHKILNFLRFILNAGLLENITEEVPDSVDVESSVLNDICLELFKNDIDEVLKDERERKIIHTRYGLDDGSLESLQYVAQLYGITLERVKQIEHKTMFRLRRRAITKNKEKIL